MLLPFFIGTVHSYYFLVFIVQHFVLLDIEGTTTPISFFTDVLLPYVNDNLGKHLAASYDSEETQNDISLLRSQVRFFFSLSMPLTFLHV